jgi:hypothetical protein
LDDARAALGRAEAVLPILDRTKPVEAAMVRAQLHAVGRDAAAAADTLGRMLAQAPPGFAGWTIPVEPHLTQLAEHEVLTKIAIALADRAM